MYLVAVFCLCFFRDPERAIPGGRVVVSPADGKVLGVRAESGDRTRVSVFMNVFDVHVNRALIGGSRVAFKQVAGLMARRIVCYKKAGDAVARGERVGLTKFGSRVDPWLGPEWLMVHGRENG